MIDFESSTIKQFDKWAPIYDRYLFFPFVFANRRIIEILKQDKFRSILDVGCGTGILLNYLNSRNEDIELNGLDISPEMARLSREKLGESANIIVGSSENIPFEKEKFEIVTCSTSFHHYANPQKSVDEMYRVLKPGGKLIILDPFLDGKIRKMICNVLNLLFQEKDVKMFRSFELKELFINAGFINVNQRVFSFYKLITIGQKEHNFG